MSTLIAATFRLYGSNLLMLLNFMWRVMYVIPAIIIYILCIILRAFGMLCRTRNVDSVSHRLVVNIQMLETLTLLKFQCKSWLWQHRPFTRSDISVDISQIWHICYMLVFLCYFKHFVINLKAKCNLECSDWAGFLLFAYCSFSGVCGFPQLLLIYPWNSLNELSNLDSSWC